MKLVSFIPSAYFPDKLGDFLGDDMFRLITKWLGNRRYKHLTIEQRTNPMMRFHAMYWGWKSAEELVWTSLVKYKQETGRDLPLSPYFMCVIEQSEHTYCARL